ncbi:hypothetical protein [Acidiferrimicrobium sp. IK]|uniref:hypothetical protein n=1 Tax=Acidiferrimicrobium sp. IK TaxID=2871700 RepID=UPI0021CB33F8|nr:hypothetical protein [Acidiferrimicrobium sp. IK]
MTADVPADVESPAEQTTEPPAPPTVEARLDALPSHWPTDDLRQALAARTAAAAVRAEHADRAAAARAALTEAVAAGDLDAAVANAAELAALERVESLLPAAVLPADAGAAALEVAGGELIAAQNAAIMTPPAYAEEKRAWRSLGLDVARIDGPTALASDVEAERRFGELLDAGQRLAAEIANWQREVTAPGRQALDFLGAASGLLERLGQLTAEAEDADRMFRAADAERRRLGLTWRPPTDRPQVPAAIGQRVITR